MGYSHIDIEVVQSPKRKGQPCGDGTWVKRTAYCTSFALADGIGSGIHAHLAAGMNLLMKFVLKRPA